MKRINCSTEIKTRMRLCTFDDFPVDVEKLRTREGSKILFAKVKKVSDNILYIDEHDNVVHIRFTGKLYYNDESACDLMLILPEPVIKKEYQNQYRYTVGVWQASIKSTERVHSCTRIGMIERTFEDDKLIDVRLMKPEEYENL